MARQGEPRSGERALWRVFSFRQDRKEKMGGASAPSPARGREPPSRARSAIFPSPPAADHLELLAAADQHLPPESAVTVVVSAIFYEGNPSLYVNWTDGGGHMLILGKERDGEEYYKLYRAGRKNTYENWDNERAQKTVVRRRWLGWLRDDLW